MFSGGLDSLVVHPKVGFKGPRYCPLTSTGLGRSGQTQAPPTYLKSYQVGDPWRKKVQDEKARAKLRMQGYPRSELATALNTYGRRWRESSSEERTFERAGRASLRGLRQD